MHSIGAQQALNTHQACGHKALVEHLLAGGEDGISGVDSQALPKQSGAHAVSLGDYCLFKFARTPPKAKIQESSSLSPSNCCWHSRACLVRSQSCLESKKRSPSSFHSYHARKVSLFHFVVSSLTMVLLLARPLVKAVSQTAGRAFSSAPVALPDLAYDYAALEPTISAEIMEIHHSKHHQT